ncbi:hydrogenase expression/formation protein [Phaeovibrio sulfidiphilus]|uniref:Hydrogenase expression/formation protein n=1 Tax=Phaeovibrio sulfidiphilus TaxID=1220600 RepID=A0A8J6YMB9_9PROT|nr:hydrogenase expression/formation C-terminal domain-containing protein [Phaeovibrio sulfidiphilus]MBE1236489.1 hydrogenase expression/formation protein [Phaeovibrio sulfidiphilus]
MNISSPSCGMTMPNETYGPDELLTRASSSYSEYRNARSSHVSPMAFPQGMHTFARPVVSASDMPPETVRAVADHIGDWADRLDEHCRGDLDPVRARIDFRELPSDVALLANDVLGQGEVSAIIDSDPVTLIQETAFAGLWRVVSLDDAGVVVSDHTEIGRFPSVVSRRLRDEPRWSLPDSAVAGVRSAVAGVLAELRPHLESGIWVEDAQPHVVALTLLPLSQDDIMWMAQAFGVGSAVILSRGYGNCRITSTRVQNLWWVQYFNSEDKMILNTLEVAAVPDAAQAAPEDLLASAARLRDWAKELTVP